MFDSISTIPVNLSFVGVIDSDKFGERLGDKVVKNTGEAVGDTDGTDNLDGASVIIGGVTDGLPDGNTEGELEMDGAAVLSTGAIDGVIISSTDGEEDGTSVLPLLEGVVEGDRSGCCIVGSGVGGSVLGIALGIELGDIVGTGSR